MELKTLTPEQVRAARALLKIDQGTLANWAGVSIETVKRYERSDGPQKAQETTVASIGGALEKKGIIFIKENEKSLSGGVGVRFAERFDVDEWNQKVDDVMSEVGKVLSDLDYEGAAQKYKKELDGDVFIKLEDIESVVSNLLDDAADRVLKIDEKKAGRGFFNLFSHSEDE